MTTRPTLHRIWAPTTLAALVSGVSILGSFFLPPIKAGASIAAPGQLQNFIPFGEVRPSANSSLASSAPHLNYYGGRVISNVAVIQVIYGEGKYLPETTSPTSPSVSSFYGVVTGSPHFDWLSEYGTSASHGTNQAIGRGTFAKQVTINPDSRNNGSKITDGQIQGELRAQLDAGTLARPTTDAHGNVNTFYPVFFRHGQQICKPGGECSLVDGGFCAYHSAFSYKETEVYYSVQPDLTGVKDCGGSSDFGNTTSVASHELVEAVTDPEIGLVDPHAGPKAPMAWYDPANGEIGDICNAQQGSLVGADGKKYVVQKEFSNQLGKCIIEKPAGPKSGGLDLTFVVDTTGSMGDDIDAVKSAASIIVSTIAASGRDYRVALVDYKDLYAECPSDGYAARVDSPLSNNKSAFIAAINSLGASGGCDAPESVYSGVMTGLNLSWRAGAQRAMIVMGDAPPHDPEPVTNLTLLKVVLAAVSRRTVVFPLPTSSATAKSAAVTTAAVPTPDKLDFANPVQLYTIDIGGTAGPLFAELANETGGKEFNAPSAADVVSAILDAVGSIGGSDCPAAAPTIVGTDGPDLLVGTPGPDIIYGLGGDDRIVGLGGDDILCGGEGNDAISGGDGSDRLFGGPGDDQLSGDAGDDTVVGGPGHDALAGDDGSDRVDGTDSSGGDYLAGGLGADACHGDPEDALDSSCETKTGVVVGRLAAASRSSNSNGPSDSGMTTTGFAGAPSPSPAMIAASRGTEPHAATPLHTERIESPLARVRCPVIAQSASGLNEWRLRGVLDGTCASR